MASATSNTAEAVTRDHEASSLSPLSPTLTRAPSIARLPPTFLSSFMRRSTMVLHSIQRDVLDDPAATRLPPIYLARPAFWLAWLLVLGLQVTALLFLLVFALVYYRLAQPGSETVRVVYFLPSTIALRGMSLVTLLTMVLYVVNLQRMLSASLATGRLAFRHPPATTTVAKLPSQSQPSKAAPAWERLRSRVRLTYRTVFGRRGLFGIEHRYFAQVLVVREGVEIASQSFQSYRLSRFVAVPALNGLSCLLLVVNCWSTPVIHFLIRKHTSGQRVACLVVDLVLQFVWAIVMPVRLVAPYIRAYSVLQQRFPDAYASDNTFMLGWEMQSQQVLASSLGDFLTKLTPMLSIFAACRAIGSMLEPRPLGVVDSTPIAPIVPIETTLQGKATSGHDEATWGQPRDQRLDAVGSEHRATAVLSEREFWLRWSNRKMTRLEKATHAVYALWGVVAVAIQWHTTSLAHRGADASCLVELRPWFASRYSCALVEFDCFVLERQRGLVSPAAISRHMDDRLKALDPLSVQFLSLTHCPTLEIPARIQTLTNLRGVEIYNSTIVRWDTTTAALTQQYHTSLRRLSLVRCPLRELPDALLRHDLPSTLVLLNLVATDLRTLPDAVSTAWRHVRFLVLEHSPLDSVPVAITQLALGRLGLTGSNLTTLPDFPFARFEHFVVGSNPQLTALPANLGALAALAWLVVDDTNLATLPKWMEERQSTRVYARGTPYCRTAGTSTVGCDAANPRKSGMYPIVEETERRTATLLARA